VGQGRVGDVCTLQTGAEEKLKSLEKEEREEKEKGDEGDR